jgi:hypothetical protein
MNPTRIVTLLCFTLLLAAVPPARALVLPGGNPGGCRHCGAVDCWTGFEVADADVQKSNRKNKVIQKACCGGCTFHTKLCINEPTPRCTTVPIGAINAGIIFIPSGSSPGLQVPLPPLGGSAHLCGTETVLTVSEGQRAVIQSSAGSEPVSRYSDNDRLSLICKKNKKRTGCPSTCPTTTTGQVSGN